METPVALIIFNRPATTERVFREIARARPPQLFVIGDGPRVGKSGEAEQCAAARAIVDRVDWACQVMTNYSDTNLGVGTRPASGIQWVFEHVDRAIILEDDCVPHPTFFRYCDELLDKYNDDERVMHISGDNWNFTVSPPPFSYVFSNYCYSCGWATWRRAFQHYDSDMRLWRDLRGTNWLTDALGDVEAAEFWASLFDKILVEGTAANGWDWPWLFACWVQRGLSILPAVNLITNIGFGDDATHTTRTDDERAFVPSLEMPFPLRHPPYIATDKDMDRRIVEQVGLRLYRRGMYQRLRRRCLAALPTQVRQSLSVVKTALISRVSTGCKL